MLPTGRPPRELLFLAFAAVGVAPMAGPRAAGAASARQVKLWRAQAGKATAARQYDKAIALLRKVVEASDEPGAILQVAKVLSWAGKLGASARWYRRYLRVRPRDDSARLALADVLSWMKSRTRQEEALRILDRYLERRSGDSAALLRRARVRSWVGKTDEAIADFRAYLAHRPGDLAAKLELAEVLSSRKDASLLAESLALYNEVLRRRPGDWKTQLRRARVLGWAGRIEEAVAAFRAVAKSRPADRQIPLEMAKILSWSKDRSLLARALEIYDEHLRASPEDGEARLQRARVRSWLGREKDAALDFEAYLRRHPGDAKVRLELAAVLRSSKDPQAIARALVLYDDHIRANPDADGVLLDRARLRAWAGQLEGAIADFDAYLGKHPGEAAVRLELAALLRGSKKKEHLDRALEIYDAHLAKQPDDAEVLLHRARVRAWSGREGEAIADFERYLQRKPGVDPVALELANLLGTRKEPASIARALAIYDGYLRRNPKDVEVVLRRARARFWAGKAAEAAKDFDAYLARRPEDEAVKLELAQALSATKDKRALLRALVLYDAHLARKPEDDAVLLQRARARSWAGKVAEAAADFRAYLERHPAQTELKLELASVLSWSRDRKLLAEAKAVYDDLLRANPRHDEAQLRRARVHGWIGRHAAAVEDYRAYLRRNDSPQVRVELARALADAGRLQEAAAEYKAAQERGADGPDIRLGRARVLLWSGDYAPAERELSRVRTDAGAAADLRNSADIELARLYSQTERSLHALELLDELLGRDPDNEEAKKERARLARRYRPDVVPRFFTYADKYEVLLVQTAIDSKIYLNPRFNFLLHAGLWRASDPRSAIWTQRLDLGIQGRILKSLELELAGGPRLYQGQTPKLGGRVALRGRPSSWVSLGVRYSFDDIFQELYQPGALAAQVRGSAVHGDVEVRFPYGVLAQGRFGGRSVTPDNSDLEGSGTLTVPLSKIVRVGYYGQWIAWRENSLSYWSPQAFVAHMALVRASHRFRDHGLDLEVQGSAGTAAERINGIPESGYGFAFGLSGALAYTPVDWLTARLGFQYGSTLRELVRERPPVAGEPPARFSESSTYWWLTAMASMEVVF